MSNCTKITDLIFRTRNKLKLLWDSKTNSNSVLPTAAASHLAWWQYWQLSMACWPSFLCDCSSIYILATAAVGYHAWQSWWSSTSYCICWLLTRGRWCLPTFLPTVAIGHQTCQWFLTSSIRRWLLAILPVISDYLHPKAVVVRHLWHCGLLSS
jgi:hypothetical protein